MSTAQKRKLAKPRPIDPGAMHRQWQFANEVRQTLGIKTLSPRPAYLHGRTRTKTLP